MVIHELARKTGVPAKTIRYYEGIGLLPPPQRSTNNYRQYQASDIEQVRFIASARSLGFTLAEIMDILAMRATGIAPCGQVLETLQRQLTDIDQRIADMLVLRETLVHLYHEGTNLPQDDVQGVKCVCALLRTYRETTSKGISNV